MIKKIKSIFETIIGIVGLLIIIGLAISFVQGFFEAPNRYDDSYYENADYPAGVPF